MAIDAEGCDRMIAACREHGVTLGVAYYRRFYPAVARVKSIIASGEIGEPVFAQMNAFEWFDPQPEHPRYWLLDPTRAGGGPMMDFGCHRLEVLVNLFGPVRRTVGITANVVFTRDVEDTSAVLVQFEAGMCASVTVTHAACEPQDTLHVFGTRGSIHCDALNTGDLLVRSGERERTESHPPASNVHRPLIEDFVASVSAGREPLVDGQVGRAIAAIEDVIYADATTGR
jgi:predicted dehydrogenase